MDFKFCLLAGGRPPPCSDRLIMYAVTSSLRMHTAKLGNFWLLKIEQEGHHGALGNPFPLRIFPLKMLSAFSR